MAPILINTSFLGSRFHKTTWVSGLWPLGQGPENSWGSVFVDHQADPRLQWTRQGLGEGIYSTTGVDTKGDGGRVIIDMGSDTELHL